MKNKINLSVIIVLFQIFLLLNLANANSYILSQSNPEIQNKKIIDEKKIKNIINSGLNLVIGFLSIKEIGVVSASGDSVLNCCPKTKDGAICQDISSDKSNLCETTPFSSKCEFVSECKLGCCVSEEEGTCNPRTPQSSCGDGGIWTATGSGATLGTCSSVSTCQKGCCVLGRNTQFTTSKRCSTLSTANSYEKDFRSSVTTEIECLALASGIESGACLLSSSDFGDSDSETTDTTSACRYVSETECDSMGGDFSSGISCADPDLETGCEKQSSIGCVEGRDEIFWFDSCGNQGNIYSSNRDASWNNGNSLSKDESCGAGNANIDSTECGNCNYALGSRCSATSPSATHVKDGNFVCKNMNCPKSIPGTQGIDRKNIESWCDYDASIGEREGPWGNPKETNYGKCLDDKDCNGGIGKCLENDGENECVYQCSTSEDDPNPCPSETNKDGDTINLYKCGGGGLFESGGKCLKKCTPGSCGAGMDCVVNEDDSSGVCICDTEECGGENWGCKNNFDCGDNLYCIKNTNDETGVCKYECTENDLSKCSGEDSCQDGKCVKSTIDEINTFASDPVGSEYFVRSCVDGEVEVDRCASYRKSICSESIIEDNGKTFSSATCILNEGSRCIAFNPLQEIDGNDNVINNEEKIDECEENPHCMIKYINVDRYFNFKYCIPKYSAGFDLTADDQTLAKKTCGVASFNDMSNKDKRCTVVKKENAFGTKPIANGKCQSDLFVQEMNDFCISLGDCGSYINYIGDGSHNIKALDSVNTKDRLPLGTIFSGDNDDKVWGEYSNFVNQLPDQKVDAHSIEYILGYYGINCGEKCTDEQISQGLEQIAMISGGLGTMIVVAGKLKLISLTIGGGPEIIGVLGKTIGGGGAPTSLAKFSYALIGFAIGTYVGGWLAQQSGYTGISADLMSLGGGIMGAAISIAYFGGETMNPIIFGIGAFLFALGYATREKIVEEYVIFECKPWEAPEGSDNCERCNDDPFKPCSKYRCDALGQGCLVINEASTNPICIENPRDDTTTPIISSNKINESFIFKNEVVGNYVEIRGKDGDCIRENTKIDFSLKTDEYAICKASLTRDAYDKMGDDFIKSNIFSFEHNFTEFTLPDFDTLDKFAKSYPGGNLFDIQGKLNVYVKCSNVNKKANIKDYEINFCIFPGPDLTPPVIGKYEPIDESYIKFNSTQKNLKIWVNEPAECKYEIYNSNTISDTNVTASNQENILMSRSYDEMSSTMNCNTATGVNSGGVDGWDCSTKLTGLDKGTNRIFIKCRDKPWVQTDADIEKYGERNTNTESSTYTLYGSLKPLKIESVLPEGELIRGTEPAPIDLRVVTSGGMVDSGLSKCSYKWAGSWIEFFETDSNNHKQPELNLMRGSYNLPIKCIDDAENDAYGNATFDLSIDKEAPFVVRVYYEGGLKIITNEDAECFYGFEKCNFDINENTSSMTTGFSKSHFAAWTPGITHYIKCKDIFENENSECSIIVMPNKDFRS